MGLGACGGVSAWAATGGLQKTLRALGLLNVPTPTPTTPTTPTTLPQPDPSPRTAPPVGSLLQTYRGHTRSLWTATWSPDGKRIASGGDDGMVQIWDPVTGSRILIYDGYLSRDQNPSVVTLSWSPDGKRIVSGAVFLDHTVQVRDATTGSNAFIYHGYDNQVNVLDWSPDSKRIVLAGLDSTVQVWQGA